MLLRTSRWSVLVLLVTGLSTSLGEGPDGHIPRSHIQRPKPTPRPTPAKAESPDCKSLVLPDTQDRSTVRDGVTYRNENPNLGLMLEQKFTQGGFRLRLKLASRLLDTWTARFEEYGAVTMSAPLFAPPSDTFKFQLDRTDKEYFTAAKNEVNGKAAADLAIIQQFSAGLAVQLDPTAAAGFDARVAQFTPQQQLFQQRIGNDNLASAAQRKAADLRLQGQLQAAAQLPTAAEQADAAAAAYDTYSKSLSSTTPPTPPAFPGLAEGTANTPAPHSRVAPSTTLEASEQKFLDLVTGPVNIEQGNTVSDRTALTEAAGNRAVQALFTLLGDPKGVAAFDDKKVLFATVMVATNPGWRTRKDFSAEITTQIRYKLQRARGEVVQALIKSKRITPGAHRAIVENHGLAGLFPAEPPAGATPPAGGTPPENVSTQVVKEALDNARAVQAAAAEKAKKSEEDAVKKEADVQVAQVKAKVWLDSATSATQKLANATYEPSAEFQKQLKEAYPGDPLKRRDLDEAVNKTLRQLQKADVSGDSDQVSFLAQEFKKQTEKTDDILGAAPPPDALPAKAVNAQAQTNLEKVATEKKELEVLKTQSTQDQQLKAKLDENVDTLATMLRLSTDGSGLGNSSVGLIQNRSDTFFDDVAFRQAYPVVAGVSPLMETQVLDLKDSFRRQDQIALALAATVRAAGRAGQADAFEKFVKQQRKDAATRTSTPVVNTFSASGGLFGFQIGPRLQALEDPASRKGGSANVLDRQSFPALLIIGLEQSDLSPIIAKDYDGRCYVFEPVLEMRQTSRWNPLDRKLISLSKNDWWNPWSWHNPRYSEKDRLNDSLQVVDQFQDLDRWLKRERDWSKREQSDQANYPGVETEAHAYAHIMDTLQQRRDALETLMSGSVSQQFLPLTYVAPPAAKDDKAPKPLALSKPATEPLVGITVDGELTPSPQTFKVTLSTQGVVKGATVTAKSLFPLNAVVSDVTVLENGELTANVAITSKVPLLLLEVTAIKDKDKQTAQTPPIPLTYADSVNFAKQNLKPALRTTVKKGPTADGSETVTFELNPEMKDAASGLENVLIERARESLQLDIKKVKAVPK